MNGGVDGGSKNFTEQRKLKPCLAVSQKTETGNLERETLINYFSKFLFKIQLFS